MSFERRQFALEGAFARDLERQALQRHAQKLGLLTPSGALAPALADAASGSPALPGDLPTTRIASRPAAEQVFQHARGSAPAVYTPHLTRAPASQLGTRVSFGRARWDIDGTSIFSVSRGKELAQQPVRQLSHYETQRMRRVRAAQFESPTVQGLRLLPVFTPGRALLWGTVFAVWGSAACVLSGLRALGIEKGDNVAEKLPEKLREALAPYGPALEGRFAPLRALHEAQGELERPSALAALATRLRRSLSSS